MKLVRSKKLETMIDDIIAQEIAGERITIFPPGAFLFITVQLLICVAVGTLIFSFYELLSLLNFEGAFRYVFISGLVAGVIPVLFGVDIVMGKSKYYKYLFLYNMALLSISTLVLTGIVIVAGFSSSSLLIALASVTAMIICLVLMRTSLYQVLCLFTERRLTLAHAKKI